MKCSGGISPGTPEMELLLHCARPAPGAPGATAPWPVMDWPRFQILATHHHLLPLAFRYLKSAANEGARVPAEWLEYFKRQSMQIATFNLRATGILRRLQRLARDQGTRLVPIKGPALALWAYGDIALRQFEDLDLVVRRGELLQTVELFQQEGYRLRELPSGADRLRYLATGHDWSLEQPQKPPHLDLKPVLIAHTLCGPESADWLVEALRPLAMDDGGELEAPGPEAMLLAVCVDGANEGWPKLSAVADVAALLASHGSADWAGLLRDAARLGQRRSVVVGVWLAASLLECPLPAALEEAARRDPAARRLAGDAARALAAGRLPSDVGSGAVWFASQTRDGWCGRLRFWFRLLFVPGAADLDVFALPKPLYPLYAFLRPFRLGWDAVWGRPRRIRSRPEVVSP